MLNAKQGHQYILRQTSNIENLWLNTGSNMSAHVLLNLLYVAEKR